MSEPAAGPLAPRRQAALAFLLLLFFEGLVLHQYGWRRENLLHVDLPSFYFATHMALRHGQSPYDFPAMAAQAPVIGQPVFPFLHPPPTLVALAPLALVSYRAAKWAMVAMNHLLAPLLAWLLAFRVVRFPNPLFSFLVCAFVLLSFPVAHTIVHDQVNLAVAALIVLGWLGLRWERAWWPGVPLALAVLLKQSPVILLALLVAERRWRALAAAGAVLGAALAASVAAVPAAGWSDWFETVRPSLAYGAMPAFLFSPACPYNQSVNGLVSRLFLAPECTPIESAVPPAGRALAYALALGIAGLSLAALRALRRRPPETRIDHGFALLMPVMFLVSPLSWEHHLVFVLPSLAVALALVARRGRSFVPLAGLLGICVLGIALPLPIDHPALREGLGVHLISLRTYAVALLWAVLLVVAFERERGPEDAPATACPAQGGGMLRA